MAVAIFGARRSTIVGLAGMAAGSALLSASSATLGIPGYVAPIVVLTVGYPLFQTANNTAVMTDVRADPRGGRRTTAEATARRVAEAARRLERRLRRIETAADEAAIHRARISAKHLRYLLDPFVAVIPGGDVIVSRLRALQDVFGDVHDAHVFRPELATALAEAERQRQADLLPGIRSLIVSLGEFVLRQACRDAMTWPAPLRVAVNLSAAQFRRRGLVEAVERALSDSGLTGDRLELEVTETLLVENREEALRRRRADLLPGIRSLSVSLGARGEAAFAIAAREWLVPARRAFFEELRAESRLLARRACRRRSPVARRWRSRRAVAVVSG
jgi:hypothetical protein